MALIARSLQRLSPYGRELPAEFWFLWLGTVIKNLTDAQIRENRRVHLMRAEVVVSTIGRVFLTMSSVGSGRAAPLHR